MQNTNSRLKFLAILSVLLFFYAIAAAAGVKPTPIAILPSLQQQEVRGVVTDTEGMPIPGVSVIIKGTNRGTVTNLDGQYTLSANALDTLTFTYLGYKAMEVAIDGRREINVRLEEDISALDEVEINAGYYHTTKRESTGNISRVTAEEIELQPVVSPLQALQGRMAGVEIIPGGSHPGMASTIRIRGRNSLREDGNFPLYIIDGVPINSTPIESNSLLGNTGIDPLNTLNLSNIESIEVLKDADATAIYGSRGANGVVLITTKKSHTGKTSLEAQVYTGAATVPNRLELLDTEQYLQIRRQAFENDGVEPTASNAYDLVLWNHNRYTDWQDFFFGGTSSILDVNLSTSGGNENTSFRFGGSYHTQGTVHPGDYDYRRLTGGLNINHLSKDKKFEMGVAVNYGMDINNLVGHISMEQLAFSLTPNAPAIFNADGTLNWAEWDEAELDNPLAGFFNTSNTEMNNLISNVTIKYDLFPGLKLHSSFGYTNFSSRELIKRPKRSYHPSDLETAKHRSTHLQSARNSWIIEPQLVFSKELSKGHIDALLGGTLQASDFNTFTFQGEGYVSEQLIGNLTAAEKIFNARSQNTAYRYAALFGRLGFNWDQKYFLNFTGRRDGSSRFGPGKRFANFWAIGGAWIFTEDLFADKSNRLLNFGKLRASYGITGNDQIGDYGYLDAYEATQGQGGLYPTHLANSNYSWEVNKKFEGALELGFLQDRINLSVSWYRNRSSNQLVGFPLPAITGFTSIQANLPATVENKGWEVELSTFNIHSSVLRWTTSLNISFPKNELVEYPDIEQSSYNTIYRVGYPLDISLLYKYEGIDPETGFYTIGDINGDGRFDFEDRVVTQNNGRVFYGGIRNNLSYKNFSFQFLMDFVKHEGTLHLFQAGGLGNQRAEIIQALEGDSSFQIISASLGARNAYSRVLSTSFPLMDASFIRLRSLSLSYSLPSSVLSRIGIQNGNVFLNGQNLYTLTNYKGMDPELPRSGTQFAGLRTITAGLKFNF